MIYFGIFLRYILHEIDYISSNEIGLFGLLVTNGIIFRVVGGRSELLALV
jgi:hypothetical protein